ncbi:MAG TPA: hypothetical protein ENN56_00225, partial [Firmicutes bacterium]|nr:hypothetical protein [Bacillota bacterium]
MVARVILLATLLVPFAFAPPAIAETDDFGPYHPILVDWDAKRADGYYTSTNSSTLAWAEAYVLNAFMAGYRLTGDTYWLGRIADHTDTLLANLRDVPESVPYDTSIYADGYRGWGSTGYYAGDYDEYIVHDGCVGSAIAEYIAEVFNNPDELWDEFGDRAKAHFDTLSYHVAGKWLANWDADRYNASTYGTVLRHYGGFERLPHNQANAFGSFLVFLNDVVNSPKWAELNGEISPDYYMPYIDEMAAFLKNDLRVGAGDSYQWGYWPGGGDEDVSHANITVEFAWICYKRGIVFDETDMKRFANTMSKLMWNGSFENVGINKYNRPGADYAWTNYIWSWAYLSEADPFLFHIYHNFFRHRTSFSYYDIAGAIRNWLNADLAGGLNYPITIRVEDDGDGVARPGETVTLHVAFKNYGVAPDTSDYVYVDLESVFPNDGVFVLIDVDDDPLVIEPDSTAELSVTVTIPADFSGAAIRPIVSARGMLGGEPREMSKEFTVTSGNPAFLQVTPDPPTNLPYDADISSFLPKARHT